jgi:hypothetical protein
MVVDLTYDREDAEKVATLAIAFQDLFNGKNVIGPDGNVMKVGKFSKIELGAPMIKAGVPNANGDIYPEDVLGRAVSMGCTVKEDSCDSCDSNDIVIRGKSGKSRYLYASLAGAAALIAFQALAVWLGRDFLLEWIVDNICRYW